MDTNALDARATRLLIALGFSPKNIGFHYLRQALILTVPNPSALDLITKSLYPELAKHFNTKAFDVERTMRFAIGEWFKEKCPGTRIYVTEVESFLIPDKCPSNLSMLKLLSTLLRNAHTSLS